MGTPGWFAGAVFYEVLVRAFHDSDGDGVGDLRGLAAKLDYLAELGVDCLWLPPFYASPLRDRGYDVSDFRAVHPALGTAADLVLLLDEAHRRGLRVVAELPTGHTSDAHPWFRESRRDPAGPYGDFYVWRDAPPDRHGGWTPDPVRGRYFRHRHADHEPDLNTASHAVRDALLDVLRFWFDLGLDGVALDCEEPAFPAAARAVLDAEYPDRLLVTCDHHDPDQPDPAAPDGGCQMAVHAPLAGRIFTAIHRQSRFPLSEAVAQAPALPAGCQWGISLRDRGTGVRRRLASTLDNDHRQVRLCTALLLSLPGSPVLYYGDEIGMGDNVWLGDGDATPTPMQWSSDRNAGFSRCDPNRIYLPAVADPVYGYQAVNVAAQDGEEASLLQWVRRMLAVRRDHPAFGVGGFTELDSSNPSVLAYLRREPGFDPVLCVYNLSRVPQPVELDLSAYEGHLPVELTGQVRFPRIGRLTYLLTLPGHGFYWFVLAAARS